MVVSASSFAHLQSQDTDSLTRELGGVWICLTEALKKRSPAGVLEPSLAPSCSSWDANSQSRPLLRGALGPSGPESLSGISCGIV